MTDKNNAIGSVKAENTQAMLAVTFWVKPKDRESFIWKLKHVFGLEIETIIESHGSKYSGTHARCVLRDFVTQISTRRAA